VLNERLSNKIFQSRGNIFLIARNLDFFVLKKPGLPFVLTVKIVFAGMD
jgi:hypothetical protein